MTYPNLTDEEIQKLRDAIDNTLNNMKSDIRKKKTQSIWKNNTIASHYHWWCRASYRIPITYCYHCSRRSRHTNRRKQWGAWSGERH